MVCMKCGSNQVTAKINFKKGLQEIKCSDCGEPRDDIFNKESD